MSEAKLAVSSTKRTDTLPTASFSTTMLIFWTARDWTREVGRKGGVLRKWKILIGLAGDEEEEVERVAADLGDQGRAYIDSQGSGQCTVEAQTKEAPGSTWAQGTRKTTKCLQQTTRTTVRSG